MLYILQKIPVKSTAVSSKKPTEFSINRNGVRRILGGEFSVIGREVFSSGEKKKTKKLSVKTVVEKQNVERQMSETHRYRFRSYNWIQPLHSFPFYTRTRVFSRALKVAREITVTWTD